MGWGGVNFLLLLFSAVQDISWTFDFFYPLKFPLRPPQVGGIFLSIFSTVHAIYRTFDIFTTIPPSPRGGMGKKKKFDAGA